MGLNTEDVDVKTELRELCHDFLQEYAHEDLVEAVKEGKESIEIDYMDLVRFNMDLADDFINNPEVIIGHLELEVAEYEIDILNTNVGEKTVRIGNVDETTTVSHLRSKHKEKYLGVKGQVQEITQVKPKAESITFKCEHCAAFDTVTKVGPIPQFGDEIHPPGKCPECGHKNFTVDNEETVDHQVIILGEEPGKSLGAESHTVPVHVEGDLAGEVNPGDRIQVNGLVTTKEEKLTKSTPTRRPWLIKGRQIDPGEVAFEEVEPSRVDEIEELSKDSPIETLRKSFEPNIVANGRRKQAQLAVLLSMVSGVRRNGRRGDINIFLLGDKGTGKSELLKRANQLSPKSVKVSGKGATAAGLTATARPSEYGEGYTLDAGALVLANGGLAAIDEFDKMEPSARKSMHEALEDQEVPINKAGINTVLETRTAVVAAANPNQGTVDRMQKVSSQVDLGSPLLSRFDLILLFLDEVDERQDREVALRQLDNHVQKQTIDDELISEYIAYARNNYDPVFEDQEVKERISEFYVTQRQEASDEDKSAIDPRMTDALRRLSEASARLRLSDRISHEDVDLAIELMDRHIGDLLLDEQGGFRTEDPTFEDRLETQRGRRQALKELLMDSGPLTIEEIQGELDLDRNMLEHDIEKLMDRGELYEPQTGEYKAT